MINVHGGDAYDVFASKAPKALSWRLLPGIVLLMDVAVLTTVFVRGDRIIGLAYLGAALALFLASGTYRHRFGPSLVGEAQGLAGRLAVAAALVGTVAWNAAGTPHMLRLLPLGAAALLVGRFASYAIVRRLAAKHRQPVLICGAGNVGVEFASVLNDHPEYGLVPVGFLDQVPDSRLPLPVLGTVEELRPVARRFGCRNVIVSFGATREAELVHILRDCESEKFDLWVVPRLYELGVAPPGPHTVDIWGLPLVEVSRRHARRRHQHTKRALDVVVSSTMLLLAAPIFIAIALAVKLSSPGPVFFRQERVGRRGRSCGVLKFRSMRVHDASDTAWTADQQVTRIGRFIRTTSLDELPQLINVLRGDMSLVGPRPERPHFAQAFAHDVAGYADRDRVLPGMTGWAQVHGLRGDTSIAERVRFDNRYIEHWSVLWDLQIMVSTIPAIVREVAGPLTAAIKKIPRPLWSAVRVTGLVALTVALVGVSALAATATTAAPSPVTYTDKTYTVAESPTQDKPQSKLWYLDGRWWGLMQSTTDASYIHIFELRTDHTWRDTGTRVSTNTGRGDVLVDGTTRAWVASRTSTKIEIARLRYSTATHAWAMDSGFPKQASSAPNVESTALAKDSTGALWITYTYKNQIWVARGSSDGTSWTSPFHPNVSDYTIDPDDISSIVSFGNSIGVMWSDQQSKAFRFVTHRDGFKDSTWGTLETPASGTGIAEDHINLKANGNEVIATHKTSLNDLTPPVPDDSPLVEVDVRDASGNWVRHTAWDVAHGVTRPVSLIDRTNNRLYLFGTSPEIGGKIYYKSAPLDTLDFPAGKGEVFMSSGTAAINNATSTKQDVNATTGIVLLASAQPTKTYYHGELQIVAPDTQAPSAPSNITATPVSATTAHITWGASTDDRGVAGYRIARDGTTLATVSTNDYIDGGLTPSGSYSYTVTAFDDAGNAATGGPVSYTSPALGELGIDFRSAAAGHAPGTTKSVDVPAPAGMQPGDVMIASVDVRGNPVIPTPAGWTLVRIDQNDFSLEKATFVKVATDTEPATYTFAYSQTQSASANIVAYVGVDTTNPVDTSSGNSVLATNAITASGITTTANGDLLVGLYGTAVDATFAPPASAAERSESISTEGKWDAAGEISDEIVATAGPTGNRTATASLYADGIGQLVALRPAP